jgi:hypothetical protein
MVCVKAPLCVPGGSYSCKESSEALSSACLFALDVNDSIDVDDDGECVNVSLAGVVDDQEVNASLAQ